uniref:Uncharacterized protein n=1 Tax=Utricularia reniformis TaxID=192314 RepID=A0A1Y0B0L1_9LAMI|nr:hypothetical protein AEK19_MT0666 [Utricularia reniformis]ART30917.1 hypothetical protein AEK19_MT0666 [Utricularia reniformis]
MTGASSSSGVILEDRVLVLSSMTISEVREGPRIDQEKARWF